MMKRVSKVFVECSVCCVATAQVDPAAFEISGHIIFKRSQDYENMDQADVWRLLSYASYSEADVQDIARKALAFDRVAS